MPRRLNKFVRDATTLSVAEVERRWREGRIVVERPDGRRGTEVDQLVFSDDVVRLDGDVLIARREHHTIAFNKPRSVTTTARDPKGKRDLQPWLREMPTGAFPVGRLDRETTGLLLLTTDGDLCSTILRPEHHTTKVYWLWLNEHVVDDDQRLQQLIDGVTIQGRLARAAAVSIQNRTDDYTELRVTLHSGRNRQIRRMCRALDLRLLALHRCSVGTVTVEGLTPGEWRTLSASEVRALWESTGGRRRLLARKIAALEGQARAARVAGRRDGRLEAWLRDHRSASLD